MPLLRDTVAQAPGAVPAKARRRVVVMPKFIGIPYYYEAVHEGVRAAAAELPGLAVHWLGPRQDSVEQQTELLARIGRGNGAVWPCRVP
jgi:ABC-type sugar transport system substrate-binding protein